MNTTDFDDGASVIGRLLAVLRTGRGYTQEELAERAQISVRGLRNIELGKVSLPRARTVAVLLDVLEAGETERSAIGDHLRRARQGRSPGPRTSTRRVGPRTAVELLERHLDAGESAVLMVGSDSTVLLVCPEAALPADS